MLHPILTPFFILLEHKFVFLTSVLWPPFAGFVIVDVTTVTLQQRGCMLIGCSSSNHIACSLSLCSLCSPLSQFWNHINKIQIWTPRCGWWKHHQFVDTCWQYIVGHKTIKQKPKSNWIQQQSATNKKIRIYFYLNEVVKTSQMCPFDIRIAGIFRETNAFVCRAICKTTVVVTCSLY